MSLLRSWIRQGGGNERGLLGSESILIGRRGLDGVGPDSEMFFEKGQDAAFVLSVGRGERLIVLGPLDEPEFLGRTSAGEEFLSHVRLDVVVGAAMDQQPRA